MTQKTLIAAGTAGDTADDQTQNYQYVTYTAPGLAGAETCTVQVVLPDGATAVAARDVNGTNTGLTASVLTRTFFAGPTYRLTLSATAADCGVYADYGGRVD